MIRRLKILLVLKPLSMNCVDILQIFKIKILEVLIILVDWELRKEDLDKNVLNSSLFDRFRRDLNNSTNWYKLLQ